jgi:hypothetical protein
MDRGHGQAPRTKLWHPGSQPRLAEPALRPYHLSHHPLRTLFSPFIISVDVE